MRRGGGQSGGELVGMTVGVRIVAPAEHGTRVPGVQGVQALRAGFAERSPIRDGGEASPKQDDSLFPTRK
jgi:hypothetical protein